MFLDEIHYVEELWASSTDTLNCMLRHRLSAENFVFAKIWLNRKEIEKAASTNVVRLSFIENYRFDYLEDRLLEMNIGIERWKDDHYEITDPPLKIELVMYGTTFDLSMSVPSERNAVRERLVREILKIKPCVCEPEVLETLDSFNLELFHFDRSEDELDVNDLIKELPNRLKTFNERFLMPLTLALSKPEVSPDVDAEGRNEETSVE